MMKPALFSLAAALMMSATPLAMAEDAPSPAVQVYEIDFLHGQAPRQHTFRCELSIAAEGDDMSFGVPDSHMPVIYDYQAACSTSESGGEEQRFSGELQISQGRSVRFEGGDPLAPFLTTQNDCQGWPDTPLGEVEAPPCWVNPDIAEAGYHMLRRE